MISSFIFTFGNQILLRKPVCNPFTHRYFGDWIPKILTCSPWKMPKMTEYNATQNKWPTKNQTQSVGNQTENVQSKYWLVKKCLEMDWYFIYLLYKGRICNNFKYKMHVYTIFINFLLFPTKTQQMLNVTSNYSCVITTYQKYIIIFYYHHFQIIKAIYSLTKCQIT